MDKYSTITDLKLMKYFKCQYRGMISLKRSSIFEMINPITKTKKKIRIPFGYANGEILYYRIYKSIFFKMFDELFKTKKVNYSTLKKIGMLIVEKTIIFNKKISTNLAIRQENYDEVKMKAFENLENILNLFLDNDLENSMNNCFTLNINAYDYLSKRIGELKNPYILEKLPKLNMDKLKEANLKISYDILSINKTGDNTASLVLVAPFDINEGMKHRFFWIATLFHYFNKQYDEPEYNKFFLNGWFVISEIIVYNPLTLKRSTFREIDFSISFSEIEIMRFLIQTFDKIELRNMYSGECEYCECKTICSQYNSSSLYGIDEAKEKDRMNKVKIKL